MLAPGVRAIFLGAGRASRLLPYTENCPKWELEVGGQTILDRLVACAHECGIADVVVVRGAAGGAVRCPSVRYVEDHAGHNMVYSLFKAREFLRGEVVISYADILYDPAVLEQLLACTAPIAVVVDLDWKSYFSTRANDPRSVAESLVLDGSRIAAIGQPLRSGETPDAQYIGLVKVSSAGAEILQDVYDDLVRRFEGERWRNASTFEDAYMTDLLQELIDRNVEVQAVPICGGWVEFDTRSDYESVLAWVATGEIERYLRLDMLPQNASVLSAGGVVVRQGTYGWETLLVGDGSSDGWRLPKGMQEPGEHITVTAIREVKEETGIDAEILGYIGEARWSYTFDERVWDEHVHFFLMRPTGGSLDEHDSEFVEVEWTAILTASSHLRFESERRILIDALRLVQPDESGRSLDEQVNE
jgi:choline kinase/8-oxo-dGTP pyrophosphatase MutT (NUDIX family)